MHNKWPKQKVVSRCIHLTCFFVRG
jgi:hypothetical protein